MRKPESKKTHDARNARLNPVQARCNKIMGGREEYKKLPKDERLALRAEVTLMLEREKSPLEKWTDHAMKVLPFVKRGGKGKPMTTRKTVKVEGEKVPQGWVYAIRNTSYPYVLKIGKTYPDGIEDRMSEARRWGRAELVAKRWADDAIGAEKFMHMRLANRNLRNLSFTDCGVELFKCSEKDFHMAFTDYLYTLEEEDESSVR